MTVKVQWSEARMTLLDYADGKDYKWDATVCTSPTVRGGVGWGTIVNRDRIWIAWLIE